MPISANKIRNIIALHWVSRLSYRELSKVFNVSSSTVAKYLSAFDRSAISLAETRLLTDQALRSCYVHLDLCITVADARYTCSLFPLSHQCLNSRTTTLLYEWQRYRNQHSSATATLSSQICTGNGWRATNWHGLAETAGQWFSQLRISTL